MIYMLDTDTCAFILRKSSLSVLQHIQQVPIEQQVISSVTYAELLFGLELASKKKTNRLAFDMMMRHLSILEWGEAEAVHYAEIRAQLQKTGAIIGANDLLIAAHARSIGATLVTNNVREFSRVKNLQIENWTV